MNRIYGTEGDDILLGTSIIWWGPFMELWGVGNDEIFGFGGNDYINGRWGDDLLYGGRGNDTIVGGRGDDFIQGEGGDDLLKGGRGKDSLLGGSGRDTFLFEPHGGKDIIYDFEQGWDHIAIDHDIYETVGQILPHISYNSNYTVAYIPLDHHNNIEVAGLAGPLTADDFVIM